MGLVNNTPHYFSYPVYAADFTAKLTALLRYTQREGLRQFLGETVALCWPRYATKQPPMAIQIAELRDLRIVFLPVDKAASLPTLLAWFRARRCRSARRTHGRSASCHPASSASHCAGGDRSAYPVASARTGEPAARRYTLLPRATSGDRPTASAAQARWPFSRLGRLWV